MATRPGRKRAARKRAAAPKRVVYSRELGDEICLRLAGGESWYRMSNTEGMPAHGTLYRWRNRHPDFAEKLRLAREMQGDVWAEEALHVADTATPTSLAQDKVRVSLRLALAARSEREAARAEAREERAAARAERAAALEAAVAAAAKPKVVFVSIRDFVPVRLDDGRLITREYLADGSFIDHE